MRAFLVAGSSFEGSSALFLSPTTSAGGLFTIFSTSGRSIRSGGFSQTEVLKQVQKQLANLWKMNKVSMEGFNETSHPV